MSSSWAALIDEEDNADDSFSNGEKYLEKDAIIFLIDCSLKMFTSSIYNQTSTSFTDTPFNMAVKCTLATYMNKIISSENDLLAVVFYATANSNNSSNFEHIYILHELDAPNVHRITELDKITKGQYDFATYIGSMSENAAKNFSFANVFWTCSNLFSASNGSKKGYKRIFLFTNEDDPNGDNACLRNAAKKRAKDLFDLGISIELFNINPPDHTFDSHLFYRDIIAIDEDEQIARFPDASGKFEELFVQVRRKENKKRALMRIPLSLADGLELSVKIFSLYNEAKKPAYIYLDSRTNSEVKTATEWISVTTASILMPSELEFYYDFGGEKAIFNREELSNIKIFGQPGLKLLGFKPYSALKLSHQFKHSYFVYPDEITTKGSTAIFAGLLDRMLAHEKIAICRLIARQQSSPRLVALVPQQEIVDEHGVQMKPPGFHCIPLPFADDLRHISFPYSLPKASIDAVDRAKAVISKLAIGSGKLGTYDPDLFENPVLQKHYTNLQAIALDQDLPEEINDKTKPNIEEMLKRADKEVQELRKFVYGSTPTSEVKSTKKQSVNSSNGESASQKKSAFDKIIDDKSCISLKDFCEDESKLSKMTVASLKDIVGQIGLTPKRLKAELVTQISDYLNNSFNK